MTYQFNNENYKHQAVDATPLNTQAINFKVDFAEHLQEHNNAMSEIS